MDPMVIVAVILIREIFSYRILAGTPYLHGEMMRNAVCMFTLWRKPNLASLCSSLTWCLHVGTAGMWWVSPFARAESGKEIFGIHLTQQA